VFEEAVFEEAARCAAAAIPLSAIEKQRLKYSD
jgi:hypothetical protein